jgi:hypothetical protein
MKAHEKKLNSEVMFPKFRWAPAGTKKYEDAINHINAAYKKMLQIGQAKQEFRDKVCPMMTATSSAAFNRARRNIDRKYNRHLHKKKPILTDMSVDADFLPRPQKNDTSFNERPSTARDVLVKEKILAFEHDMASLNMFHCSQCLECHIEAKPPTGDLKYVCQLCQKRGNPNYIISSITSNPFGTSKTKTTRMSLMRMATNVCSMTFLGNLVASPCARNFSSDAVPTLSHPYT